MATFVPSASRMPAYADYRIKVTRFAEERNGGAVYNGSIEHAIIVIETLFRFATSKVQILTGFLNPIVYGTAEVVVAAHRFLSDPRSTVDIIMDSPPLPNNPFIDSFLKLPNFRLRRLRDDGTIMYNCHFMLADNDCYRFEEDKSKISAVAAFGDSKGSAIIADAFATLWPHATHGE